MMTLAIDDWLPISTGLRYHTYVEDEIALLTIAPHSGSEITQNHKVYVVPCFLYGEF